MIVVATKLDATTDKTRLETLREFCLEHNLEFHAISAATGEGVSELVRAIADALDKIPRPAHEATLDLPLSPDEIDEHAPGHDSLPAPIKNS
jgi:50S ribosomal subunit-associated GTPase HflX